MLDHLNGLFSCIFIFLFSHIDSTQLYITEIHCTSTLEICFIWCPHTLLMFVFQTFIPRLDQMMYITQIFEQKQCSIDYFYSLAPCAWGWRWNFLFSSEILTRDLLNGKQWWRPLHYSMPLHSLRFSFLEVKQDKLHKKKFGADFLSHWEKYGVYIFVSRY